MTATLYAVPEPEEPDTRGLLETLLADDENAWGRFEAECSSGVVELRRTIPGWRAALLKAGHVFETHEAQHEETFNALLGLAEDLLPDSPGAVRARLRARVSGSVTARGDGGVKVVGAVGCRRAVEVVVAHEDAMFDETVLAAGAGHARLYNVAARMRAGLAGIGHEYPVRDVEDELWMLVREMAPSPPRPACIIESRG